MENASSGAFANCELFFNHLGIWDRVERNAMGDNDAAVAFGNKQLDAFWLFTAFPSGAVIMGRRPFRTWSRIGNSTSVEVAQRSSIPVMIVQVPSS